MGAFPRFVMDTLPADGHIRERGNSSDVIQLNVTGVALDLAILEADSFAVLRRNAKDAGEIGFPGGSCGALVRSEALPSQGQEGPEGPCVFDPNVAMCKGTCQDRETIVKKAFGVYRRGERAHGIRKNNNAEGRATTCWEPPQPHGRHDPQGTWRQYHALCIHKIDLTWARWTALDTTCRSHSARGPPCKQS